MEKKLKKYPYQIASVKREKKVLGVEANLFSPEQNDDVPPLQMHAPWSRFTLTGVDAKEGIQPKFNMGVDEVRLVYEKTKICIDALMRKGAVSTSSPVVSSASASGGNSIGYTQRILMTGEFNKMTPVEVLVKDSANKNKLLTLRDRLAMNVDKYTANRKQMEAIDDAIKLFDAGKLGVGSEAGENNTSVSAPISATSSAMEVFKTEYKYFRTTNSSGENLIYSAAVNFDSGRNYPFAISIVNAWAPVISDPKGGSKIKLTEAHGQMKFVLNMTELEWYSVISRMYDTLANFERSSFARMFKMANDNSYWNSEEGKKKSAEYVASHNTNK